MFIIPYDIRQRLLHKEGKCVALLNDLRSCDIKVKYPLTDLMQKLDALARFSRGIDYTTAVKEIKVIVDGSLCGTHINKAIRKINELEEALKDLSDDDSDAFDTWIRAIAGMERLSPTATAVAEGEKPQGDEDDEAPAQTIFLRRSTRLSQLRRSETFTKATRMVNDVKHFVRFKPYLSRIVNDDAVAKDLNTVLRKPLGKNDVKSGYIYIFWHKGQFGHVKIGRSKDPESRLDQWKKKCRREHEFHKSSKELIEVEHVNRVEKLIHTELQKYRLTTLCEGCGRKHKEWFEVPEQLAVEVFNKWKDFILQKPYVEDSKGKYILREGLLATISDLCQPLGKQEAPKTSPERRKVKPRASTGGNGRRLSRFLRSKSGGSMGH
jgi:hypothetical protein